MEKTRMERASDTTYTFPESPMASPWDIFAHLHGFYYSQRYGLVPKFQANSLSDLVDEILDEVNTEDAMMRG